MQAPHNGNGQRQDEDIGNEAGNTGETSEVVQIDATSTLDGVVPNGSDGDARKGGAKDGDEAADNADNDKGELAHAPLRGRGFPGEETAVEEQDGNFDGGHCKGMEQLVRIHELRVKSAGRFGC